MKSEMSQNKHDVSDQTRSRLEAMKLINLACLSIEAAAAEV